MKYIIFSVLAHIFLFAFLFFQVGDQYKSSGGKEGGSQGSSNLASSSNSYILENNEKKEAPEQKIAKHEEIKTDKNIIEIENKNIKEKKTEDKNIKKKEEKKEEPSKKNKGKKDTKKTQSKNKENKITNNGANNHKGTDKNDGENNDVGNNAGVNNSVGKGNATGEGKGNGKGNSINGMGEGNAKEDAAIASSISQIQDKIMQYWAPPEEFAARKDIIIEIELNLDNFGNIISYKLLNQKNTREYQTVASSVIRVLNDPRVVPLPIIAHKKFKSIILSFCPRDLL